MVAIVKRTSLGDMSRVGFDRFWQRSRFHQGSAPAIASIVKNTFDSLSNVDGAIVEFLELGDGNIAVFKDPKYHSLNRQEIGCFGLITAPDERTCDALVTGAIVSLRAAGINTVRGPVNVPRFLFGYGVQTSGFDLPVVAGVSADPPEYKSWFGNMVSAGLLKDATRYVSYVGSLEKSMNAFGKTRDRDQLPVIHPDFNNPGTLPEQIAALMNAGLHDRPDGFHMEPADVLSYAKLFKCVPHGEQLLALLMDGETLAGGVIMQPDWFQVLSGARPTRLVQDTIVTSPAYQGKGFGMQYFRACAEAMKTFNTDYFEYIYGLEDGTVTNHFGNTYCLPGKTFSVYESA